MTVFGPINDNVRVTKNVDAIVIPKSCHQHVMRSLTPMFSVNPKLGVETCSGYQFYMKKPSTALSFYLMSDTLLSPACVVL